ncbi:hypothetical protein EDD64_10251 [Effusibacillus lacus]|nr:hypothetical protein EDD64_10251 [Effusibacillus lacus]
MILSKQIGGKISLLFYFVSKTILHIKGEDNTA